MHPASQPRCGRRCTRIQPPDHVGKEEIRLSSFPTASASRLSTNPDFPLRRIEIVAPIPQVFDKTKRLLPIGQEDKTALDLGRQDEGFFPKITYRLVPLQLDGGESRGVQGRTQGKWLGGDEVFPLLLTDFDAGREDTDGLLAEEGGEAGDRFGLHPQDGTVCPGPAGDEAAGICQVRFHVAGKRTGGDLLRPLLFRFLRGKGNVAIVRLAEDGEEYAS